MLNFVKTNEFFNNIIKNLAIFLIKNTLLICRLKVSYFYG